MSVRDYFRDRLDVNRNGKVDFNDAVTAAEERFGQIQVRWGFGGFVAGVVITFVVLKVIL